MDDPLGSRPRRAVLAFSWANLVLYQAHTQAPTEGTDGAYWMTTSSWLAAELDGLLLLVGLLTLAAVLLTEVIQHRAGPRGRRWFALLFGASLAIPLAGLTKDAIQATGLDTGVFLLAALAVLGLAILAGLAWLARASWQDPERVLAAVAAGLVITAPFAAFVTGSALHARYRYASMDLEGQAANHLVPASPEGAPPEQRVVVLVFDEFDRRIAFEDRPEGFALPTIDRLTERSIVAEQAYSTAPRTLFTMPALLTGLPVVEAEPEGASELRLKLAEGNTTSLTEADTLFSTRPASAAPRGLWSGSTTPTAASSTSSPAGGLPASMPARPRPRAASSSSTPPPTVSRPCPRPSPRISSRRSR